MTGCLGYTYLTKKEATVKAFPVPVIGIVSSQPSPPGVRKGTVQLYERSRRSCCVRHANEAGCTVKPELRKLPTPCDLLHSVTL